MNYTVKLLVLNLLVASVAWADVVRDGSIGPGIATQPTGPNFVVDQTMGQVNGNNLFHSFSQFDLSAGQTATFTATVPLNNVISRITGGASNIDGTVSSSITGANIFLINPAGIVYGNNAQINVAGSFYTSSADYLEFSDGNRFYSDPAATSTLSNLDIQAFGFLGVPLGDISIQQSRIRVGAGETIGVVAANIDINDDGNFAAFSDPTLQAVNGLIYLAAVGSAGEVALNNQPLSDITTPVTQGNILFNDSFLDVSGSNAGDIQIQANQIDINRSYLFANNNGAGNARGITLNAHTINASGTGGILATNIANGTGGDINIHAANIAINNGFTINAASEAPATGAAGNINITSTESLVIAGDGIALLTESRGAGDAGDINIQANALQIDATSLQANSLISGAGGDITIHATDIDIRNNVRLATTTNGSGDAGNITINATRDIMVQGAEAVEIVDVISSETNGTGAAGNIEIQAQTLTVDEAEIKASTKGDGNAGNVNIHVDQLHLINGGQLSSTTQFGGDGGNVNVNASQSLHIEGSDAEGNASGLFAESRASSSGNAGSIHVSTPELMLLGDGEILSDALGSGNGGDIIIDTQSITMQDDAEIASDVSGSGSGGNVQINTQTLLMQGDSEISADTETGSSGNSGNVVINASESVTLRIAAQADEEGGIFTNSEGSGNAGDITITSPKLDIDGGVLNALTQGAGTGGTINLQIAELSLDNMAAITARSEGSGDAGNINIQNAQDIRLRNGSSISTESANSNGGNIIITAQENIVVRESEITANVNEGTGGNIDVNADTVVLDNSQVVAQAGAGTGGAIQITANKYLNGQSIVSASAGAAGISGTVDINATEVDLSGSLEKLATEFVDTAALINSICARPEEQRQGRFIVTTYQGLPSSIEGIPLALDSDNDIVLRVSEQKKYADQQIIDLLDKAREAIELDEYNQARRYIKQATIQLSQSGNAQAYQQVYLARTHILYANQIGYQHKQHAEHLLIAHNILQTLIEDTVLQHEPRAASYVWGNQALLYQQQQRYKEALYLLRTAQQYAERANASESLYVWHWLEGQIYWALGKTQASIDAYQRAVDILDATRQNALVGQNNDAVYFQKRVEPIYRDLVAALLSSSYLVNGKDKYDKQQALLYQARSVLERYKAAELRDYFNDPCLNPNSQQQVALDQVADDAAVVYPVILDNRLELLVSLKDAIYRYKVDINKPELHRTLRRFRQALQKPYSKSHLAYSKKLYGALVEPYKNLLTEKQITTLVFVMDGHLRTVPMAALHSGETYLLSEYAIAVSTGLDLVQPAPVNIDNVNLLMAGISESVQGFPELPYVPTELDGLQRLFGGEKLLNQQFKLNTFSEQLAQQSPSIVHLASHAEFNGKADNSFLLAYDGRITLGEMAEYLEQRAANTQSLELLVLSACQTAAGDDRAALGLAGVGIKAGARSALGSLWSIPDQATQVLMNVFYKQLKNNSLSRAKALQQAQLALLENPEYAHPFHWSAFLMINNWL